ncbi:MAG: rRNA cytosine-C5-methyltransferase [Bacteroidales bacterium]|nr:rRNA cytosine-C5-methyltransferase [Bacteroidales bacterium]
MISETFRKYLTEAIGSENALVAFSAFDSPSSASVRLNPFKPSAVPEGIPVSWSPYGILLPERPKFTLDPLFHCGAYYVQDSSSMFVGHVFRDTLKRIELPEDRPIRVLDLCAAPGGKTTDIAASLREVFGDRFLLVANEVMKQRAGVLAENVALWGDPNVVVTSDDPRAFAAMPGFFDLVVADVPCSGEGMFRKDEEAQRQWSEDNVALCEARQRRIIADMWPSLKTGGILIYSTCTFNRYENDGNVAWIASNLGAEPDKPVLEAEGVIGTESGYSLVPGHVAGEGQYCSSLRKIPSSEDCVAGYAARKNVSASKSRTALPDSLKSLFCTDVVLRCKGDTVTALPTILASEIAAVEQHLHVLAAGCAVGVMKGNVLVPDADLALSLIFNSQSYPSVEVDERTALSFLHKDAIVLPEADRGYLVIRYKGLGLGFVKNLGNRCNNLHPQARRIRMDI